MKKNFVTSWSFLLLWTLNTSICFSAAGAPRHRGKPQFPITVETNLHGTIPANTSLKMEFKITTEKKCEKLKISVRGLEDVNVSGEKEKTFNQSETGIPTRHTVQVQLPTRAAGYVALDLHCTTENNANSVSKTFLLRTKGSHFKKAKSKLSHDEKGEPVIILQPKE